MLDEVIKQAPDYVPASMVLAEIAAVETNFDECAGLLTKVLALDPENFDALLFQGQMELTRGEADQAATDMERMSRVYPQVARVHYQLGTAYFMANDPVKAADSLNRALELNPNFTEASLLLAQTQIKSGNASPAIVSLERLRQKQPQVPEVQLLLADAYRLQGRLDAAMTIYSTLENSFPKNEQIPLLHGAALLQSRDYAAARKAFERVLELSPGNLQAVEQLVDLDLIAKQFDAAMQRVNGEIQRNPQQVVLRILTAKIFLAQGNRDQAEAALLKASEIDPANQGACLVAGANLRGCQRN